MTDNLRLPATLLLLTALAASASATHVQPQAVEGPDNHTCSDFAEGAAWLELKVDPAVDGVYASADGSLTVTVDVDETQKTLSWNASVAVSAVFVKAGEAGHHLYVYDPAATSDTGLTTPGEGATVNQISHVSFCYLAPANPCEEDPTAPECVPTCEEEPEKPECVPTCEDNPEMPECVPTCKDNPEMPGCVPECPVTVMAQANADESIAVTVTTSATFQLLRKAGDGDFTLVGSFTGNTTLTDTETEAGVTYTYRAVVGGEVCHEATVTAIPDFPTGLAAVAAVSLGLAGYAFAGRRK